MPRLQLTHEMELMGKLRAGHARPLLFCAAENFQKPCRAILASTKGGKRDASDFDRG